MSADRPRAVQITSQVLSNEPAGAYRHLVLSAPGAAEAARPGQFVALAVGDSPTAMLLRRSFSLFRASADGPDGPTVEIVVADAGPGSGWVTRRRPGDLVDLVGPLGRPFPLAAGDAPVVLVGGGYGSAPLVWLGGDLVSAGRTVEVVLGAASQDRLFGADAARTTGATVHVTTDDGSAGTPGRVTTVLPDVIARSSAQDVYACGPMAMLRAVHDVAKTSGVRSWLAVEESMACGIGVCMTCVLPIRHPDGVTRMTRSCVDGPTFDGAAVRWDAVVNGPHGTTSLVPDDCLGSPNRAGATTRGGH